MVRRIAAVALLPVLATCAVFAFVAAESSGREPLSYGVPANIAEAAGLGSGADVLRWLAFGDDPSRLQAVRPEFISPSIRAITGLEAAVWSRRVELVRLLDNRKLIPPHLRPHLVCLAVDIRAADIVEYLSGRTPPVCMPRAAEEAGLKRSLSWSREP